MRVLVTGAAGFIGASVIRQLLAGDHQVIAVDRSSEALERLPLEASAISRAAIDLADEKRMAVLLNEVRPDAVIHLAWYADPIDYLTSHANILSLTVTSTLVEAALSTGCRKFVIGGSCAEYARCDRLLVESDPVEPRTLYAAAKRAAWQVACALTAETGAELAWARIFHIHGPMESRRRLIPWVASQLRSGLAVELTDGKQIRDQLHVSDVASGLVTLLGPGASGIYNVCSGEPVTLKQVLETVGELVGGKDLLRFGARPYGPNETMFLAGDSSRLRALGWAPRFGLRDGLQDALREGF